MKSCVGTEGKQSHRSPSSTEVFDRSKLSIVVIVDVRPHGVVTGNYDSAGGKQKRTVTVTKPTTSLVVNISAEKRDLDFGLIIPDSRY